MQHFFDPAGEEVVFQGNAIADVMSGESDLKFSLPQRPLGVVIDLISYCADPCHFVVDEGQFLGGEGEGVRDVREGGVGDEVSERGCEGRMSLWREGLCLIEFNLRQRSNPVH